MSFPSLLMEDHCYAYSLWKEKGLKDGICVHVDAHLDLMDRGFTPELLEKVAQVKSASDLQSCLTPTFLPWAGVHCGNYLYPALMEGVVSHLIWVVPKEMIEPGPLLEWARDELTKWMELTLEENDSLHLDGARVEGVLAGQRFTLCTSENLPELDQRPILLDVDVDYFQDQSDRIWQTPGQLARELNLPRIDALTIAVSVDGGYTCLEHRYLAEVIEQVFQDGPDCPWEARTLAILAADQKRESEADAYDELAEDEDPDWLRATLSLKRALARGESVLEACGPAAEMDPRFRALEMNEALCHFRAGRLEQALKLAGGSGENLFVRAVLAFQGGQFEVAKESWDTFLETTDLVELERAFALFIRGQSVLQLSTPQDALNDFAEAAKLSPSNYQYALFYGLVLQLTGDLKKAAKVWRKALSRHGERLASIGLHLELSRLYRVMGKAALADSELRRVSQKDKSGDYKMVIQLEHLRSSKIKPELPEPCLPGLWAGPMMGGVK